jgi:hypothetical protein
MKYQDNMTQYSTCSLNSYVDLLVSRMRDAISTKCHPWAVDRNGIRKIEMRILNSYIHICFWKLNGICEVLASGRSKTEDRRHLCEFYQTETVKQNNMTSDYTYQEFHLGAIDIFYLFRIVLELVVPLTSD